MFGKFVLLVFSFAALLLIGAITISCGGSSSTVNKACTGGPYNVVGPWQMTVTDNGVAGSVTLYGAIDSSGLALFFDNSQLNGSGDTAQLPTITGACSFSGNVTAYGEPGGPNSGIVGTNPVQGNVTSSTAISGTFSGNPSGTISLVPLSALGGSTVTAVTGQKLGVVQGSFNLQSILLSLTFSQSGSNNSMSFASTNLAGCAANGTFTEQGTSNVFDVSITLMPTCPITGTFSGIGFESNTDYFLHTVNAETFLYMDILDSANSFVMEIY